MAVKETPGLKRYNVADIVPALLKKTYLVGLQHYLIDPDTQQGFPDEWYQHFIDQAIDTFEDHTQVHVIPKEITSEKHDYHANDYAVFVFMSLFNAPVLEVTKFQVVYPTNVAATEFPVEWVKYQGPVQIQLVPTSGTLAQIILGRGGAYLPLIYEGGLGFLPQLFHVSYKVGFDRNMIPNAIVNCILKLAAIDVLTQAGDLVYGPGVRSISSGFDGISQGVSLANPLFQARIEQWQAQVYGTNPGSASTEGELARLKKLYHGIPFRCV
jgi:hypothetical protein